MWRSYDWNQWSVKREGRRQIAPAGLVVSNTWIDGNIMDLEIATSNGLPRITLLGEPGRPHILEGSTDFTNWIPLVTNLPVNSRFDFHLTNAPGVDPRFFRSVKL
jgi:hypothetical protein